MKEKIHTLHLTITTAIFSYIGLLVIPIVVLIVMNVVDYVSRIMAEKYNDRMVESRKSIKGIYKKAAMWFVIIATGMMDVLLMEFGHYIGVYLPLKFILAILLTLWFCINEFISICENVVEMEQKLPDFIVNGAKKILGNAEKAGQSVLDQIDSQK